MALNEEKWQEAILKTLSYHNIFDYPLTFQEIKQFFIKPSFLKSQPVLISLAVNLKKLIKEKKVAKRKEFYFLFGRKKIVDLRKSRKKISRQKIKKAQKIIKIINFIPWLKMIAISGALAMSNADKDDDIDFFIITANNRLWLTRLLIIIILEIFGQRRRPQQTKVKDKVCLNMFLDEKALVLAKTKRNLFTAHEICQLKPIFNRQQTYEKFINQNQWLKKYLANCLKFKKLKQDKIKLKKGLAFFDFLEKLAYQCQKKYMSKKMTLEKISPHFAFFHPRNRAKEILRQFKKKI